jgi:hypothetical protein
MVGTRDVGAGEWTAIEQVVSRLVQSYPEMSTETVQTVVHHAHAKFDGRPVRDFVPLFVERGAKQELSRLAAG